MTLTPREETALPRYQVRQVKVLGGGKHRQVGKHRCLGEASDGQFFTNGCHADLGLDV